MRSGARLLIATSALTAGLSSCAPSSNTPEGFTAKTDIPLCKEAHVTHVNRDDPTRVSGFIEFYEVRVKMSEKCAEDFFRDFERSSGKPCPSHDSCHVLSRRGPSIGISRKNGDYEILWAG